MNGEIPSVPITTLAGVASLVDLLPEMPLPSPLPQTLGNKSLLFHPRVAEEAQRLLTVNDDNNLLPQLIHSLGLTSSRQIELKDAYNELPLDHPSAPALLKGIVLRKADVFKGKHENQPAADWGQMYQSSNMSQSQHFGENSLDLQNQNHSSGLMNNDSLHSMMQQSLDFISGMQSVEETITKQPTDRMNPVLSFNCEGDIRTKKDHHIQPQGLPSSLTDQHNLTMQSPMYPGASISKPQLNSESFVHELSQYSHLDHHGPQVLNAKNHSGGNNLNYQSLYQQPHGTAAASSPHQYMHANSINSISSPNHLAIPNSDFSAVDSGSSRSVASSHSQSSANDSSKVNYTGAMNEVSSLGMPIVKLENLSKRNAPASYDLSQQTPASAKAKELVIKLERSDNAQLQVALNKLSNTDQNPPNVPNNSHASRKTSAAKNYCEDSSGGENDDGQSTPQKARDGREKRRKRESESEYVDAPDPKRRKSSISAPESEASVDSPKKKIRRVERMLVPVLERLGPNANILDNSTYHRFLKIMDVVLDSMDYNDREMDIDEDENVPSELLITKSQLTELCSEAAKLKALGAMASMPTDKLVRLLSVLEKNIRDGCKVSPLADAEDNEDESKLWMELTMDGISRGVASSLTALHILTSQNMPKRVYLEDLIDRVVIFTKFQLQNTIYPLFDPVYRVDRRGKDGFSSSKKKRAHAREVREKNMISFYHKIHELVGLLAELLNVQVLTDTTVLHLSTLGVSPFFVENVSELQLSALKLVTAIFTQYEKHRRLLLDDILASIARLPSSKRSLRTFKLSTNSEEHIQMLTALVLQLIQCVTYLPDKMSISKAHLKADEDGTNEKLISVEKDTLVGGKFDTAIRTAGNFLAVFLSKCGSKSEDCDYRILFENFVQDLLSTVNKPEWPAAELLLSLLGNLLVKNLGNKSLEVSMRVASLEYLGVAAARLRKDTVSAQSKMETIDRIISDIKKEEESYEELKEGDKNEFETEEEKMEFLQRLLLDYLAVHGQSDPALMHARHFYIASWWKSAGVDIGKSVKGVKSPGKKLKKKKKKNSSSSEEESDVDESEEEEIDETEMEVSNKISQLTEHRKKFLLTKVRPFSDPLTGSRKTEVVQTFVDYQSAELLTRYLASKRPFSASFDFFLTRILSVSTEQTVAIRTKSLKCLTMVVEADPSVLARNDMQMWVQNSFLDQSTSVREAAVDLIGKYVLSRPDLIDTYYEKLSLRILDTGVSVRKRVIKILRDICIECPNFAKIPEICVKMIRRVNDEDGIRKLVMEVFQNMWFTAVREEPLDKERLLRKVSHITDVVASCEKVGLDFFEQLLLSLFKPKDDKNEDVREKVVNPEPPKAVVTASRQIVDCLVEHVLRIEENSSSAAASSQRFVACVSTLFLFAKIRPQLLINHAITFEGYLSLRCQNHAELQAIANIASILELVVPLLVNPADSFLAQLEEDCVKLIFKNDRSVIEACMACLGSVVNKITHNYNLIRDCFKKFYNLLIAQTKIMRENPTDPRLAPLRPQLRRAVYTIGLFFRYFDFTTAEVYGDYPADIVHQVFLEFLFLLNLPCSDLQYLGLQAIGNLCVRHYDFMLGNELKAVYQRLLTSEAEIRLKVQALCNIQLYLTEEELRMIRQDAEWTKNAKLENIKEMGDVTSGMASTIVQIYLKQILEAFLHHDLKVRHAAVRVIQLVLQQGLVHPIQIVPYLICMSTDEEQGVATAADKQLQEMEKKHPQFLQSQVLNGIRLSLQLQRILHGYTGPNLSTNQPQGPDVLHNFDSNIPVVRGYRIRPKEAPSALNGYVYSLLRSTKPQRRAISLCILKQFDDQLKTRLADLLYYADNLAYFPYQVVDEPLFIIHHVDIVISVTGSNLLQSFKESLTPVHTPEVPKVQGEVNHSENGEPSEVEAEVAVAAAAPKIEDIMDDDDDDIESLVNRIPDDTKTLEDCIIASQGCLLLLMLKQHLKDMYGLTDTRISGYSPSDATKAFERPVNRRNNPIFEPKCTLANLNSPPSGSTPEGRQALVEQYLHFKNLMLRIDPEEEGEDGDAKQPVKIKIDQKMFTYAAKTQNAGNPDQMNAMGQGMPSGQDESGQPIPANVDMSNNQQQQYAVISNPGVRVVEPVKIPKLTIVPLKFPGNDQGKKPAHKLKEHHHHKHKKSKHKKKKRHTVSTDEDSDNPDSDPDFHL